MSRPALGLELLQAPCGRQIRQLHQGCPELPGGGGRIHDELLALQQLLQRVAARFAGPSFDHLSGDLNRVLAQVVERSEEHTSELQSQSNLVCRLLLEKKKTHNAPSDRGLEKKESSITISQPFQCV